MSEVLSQETVEAAVISAADFGAPDQMLEATVTQLENIVKTNEEAFGVNPLDQAAYVFQSSLPRINALSANMSRNALARVYRAIVEFPLAEKYPTFRNKVETELFILTLSSIQAKNMMISSFTKDQQKEIVQETTNGIVQELMAELPTKQEETVNG